jgi:7-keto-8-aminopelargonate synthetase-like enzyme
MRDESERRERLWKNARKLSEGFQSLGFNTGGTETPIIPIIVGDGMKTMLFWKELFQDGVFTNPVIAPAVPAKTSRIRTSVMATHTDEQLDRVLEIFAAAGKRVGLL